MASELERKQSEAVWVCRSLFERGKVSGSSANMSFRHEDRIYITRSGSCFGTMEAADFVALSLDGQTYGNEKGGMK